MDTTLADILNLVLNTYTMIAIWVGLMSLAIFVAYRAKAYGLLVLAGGCVPQVIFYVYRLFNFWDISPHAVLFSRIADTTVALSIMVSLWMMYRSMFYGRN